MQSVPYPGKASHSEPTAEKTSIAGEGEDCKTMRPAIEAVNQKTKPYNSTPPSRIQPVNSATHVAIDDFVRSSFLFAFSTAVSIIVLALSVRDSDSESM